MPAMLFNHSAQKHRGHGPLLQNRGRDGRHGNSDRARVCSIPCRIAILGRDE